MRPLRRPATRALAATSHRLPSAEKMRMVQPKATLHYENTASVGIYGALLDSWRVTPSCVTCPAPRALDDPMGGTALVSLTGTSRRASEALGTRLRGSAPQLEAAADDDQHRQGERNGADGGRHHRRRPRCAVAAARRWRAGQNSTEPAIVVRHAGPGASWACECWTSSELADDFWRRHAA